MKKQVNMRLKGSIYRQWTAFKNSPAAPAAGLYNSRKLPRSGTNLLLNIPRIRIDTTLELKRTAQVKGNYPVN